MKMESIKAQKSQWTWSMLILHVPFFYSIGIIDRQSGNCVGNLNLTKNHKKYSCGCKYVHNLGIPCKKCDRDFLMPYWREFGRKWDQIWRKSHDFLSKCHGNSMTWPYQKSMSCSSMENKWNLDKWHGIVMEFGVDLDQNYSVDLWRYEMIWNFHENQWHIMYRV